MSAQVAAAMANRTLGAPAEPHREPVTLAAAVATLYERGTAWAGRLADLLADIDAEHDAGRVDERLHQSALAVARHATQPIDGGALAVAFSEPAL